MRAGSSRVRSVAVPLTGTHTRARADTIIHQTFNHQKVPLALRLSGQLLLGVVRIYTRKLDFLQRDSAEALVKFRQVRCGVGTTTASVPLLAAACPCVGTRSRPLCPPPNRRSSRLLVWTCRRTR